MSIIDLIFTFGKIISQVKKIDLRTARQFIIATQFDFGKDFSTHQIIKHLGYVQIDTISVINRTHHHVLWTRNPKYVTTVAGGRYLLSSE